MINPTNEEKVEIITCLKELECCSRCILRFLGVKLRMSGAEYLDPEHHLSILCEELKFDDSTLPVKRVKKNPCRICLDIFQDATMERLAECISLKDMDAYKYPDYITSVSFPKCVYIRNRSVFVYLRKKFPNIYQKINELEDIKKIFKKSSSTIISGKIKKYFNSKSYFSLHLEIGYADDEKEIEHVKRLWRLIKGRKHQVLSQNYVLEILDKCKDKLFKDQFPVPPTIPDKETTLKVSYSADPIWLGGRYLKFSRDMGQTPWSYNNSSVARHCLLDILLESIEKVLGFSKDQMTFSASGREDVDVRMLGNGRPFYIQIDNPKDRSITFEQFRAIEKEVFKSKLAAVIKLQIVNREDIKRIKCGEELKRKHYYALCHTSAADIDHVVGLINNFAEPLEIDQKTPVRVLHRRTQSVRKKCIYSMEAKTIPGYSNLFEVKMITQAGTYVKEFVHSDFRRTNPSLSSIIEQPVDVVALDVTRVELSWPEKETQ